MRKPILFFALLSLQTTLIDDSMAQQSASIATKLSPQQQNLTGTVRRNSNKDPLDGATVQILELGLYSKTDASGTFTFSKIPKGTYTVVVQYLGMLEEQQKISFPTGELQFLLTENSITLKDVVVVGKEQRRDGATSTVISRKAIEHMQATHLGEILQLLPGAIVSNPSFTNPNKTSIRQYSGDAASPGDNMSSMGTSVIVNGAPQSNNANLQSMNTVTSGVLAGFSTSSGMGTDMRQLSADNIESVEVIRGIPSVEYGDLTSGAILVSTKAGVEPLQVKARLNPKLTQFWAGQGFSLGKDKGNLFVDLDFTKAYDNQITAYSAYERMTGSMQYTNTFGKERPLYSNTTFSFGMNLDDNKVDPDYQAEQIINKAQNYAYQFSTNGKWKLNKQFARNLNYTLSGNYSLQKGYQQRLNTLSVSANSTATENVTQQVPYLPATFLNQLWIEGKPLNIFAKLSDDFYLKTGEGTHRFLLGADYRLDANFGSGRTVDPNNPYRTADPLGFRPRSYKDIPSLNQFGVYLEDRYSMQIFDRDLHIQAGVRWDQIQPFGSFSQSVLAPRINASYEFIKDFTIRGGYGMTAKSPTLLYLYPDRAYYDAFSLNHYKENPAEAMAIISTRVFDTANPDLKIAKATKKELGLDYTRGKKRFSVTGYYEETKNGYEMNTNLNSVKFFSIPTYTVVESPVGQPPVLSTDVGESVIVSTFNAPSNDRNILNKGIEFDFDFGRFDNIRTSFVLNGAYLSTKLTTANPYILLQNAPNMPLKRIGVFEARGVQQERFVTTLRAIHNIPEFRFIITATAQTIWKDKHQYLHYSSIPVGYIPVGAAGSSPQITYFTEAERQSISEADRDIYLSLNDGYFKAESWKPLWLFNLKMTKEFANNMGFSFYANNVFNHRPLQASTRYPQEYSKRNISMFYGTEITIKF
ncbi:putative outer membrane receptor [Sphingobacterium faecium PCAi_F2.5]|jgi:outer membrane receptor for ferrienterochelin and colicin|nr:Outer membrane receptor [Sphingobacterium sp. PM2-P1-29]SJN43979.1 putative outer membrane receptor [Sphingobacterium faecium PCAi_F2.5]